MQENVKMHFANVLKGFGTREGQGFVEYLLVFFLLFGIPLILIGTATAYPQLVETIAPYILGFIAVLFVCLSLFVAGRKFWLKFRVFMQRSQGSGRGAKEYLSLLKELIVSILIAIFGALLSFMFFVGSYLFVSFGFVSSVDFDEKVWKSEVDKRYAMVRSLTKDVGLEGRTRKEVQQMLGTPLQKNPVAEVKCDECYYLGLAQIGLVPENAYLFLWYKDDKVVKVSWSID